MNVPATDSLLNFILPLTIVCLLLRHIVILRQHWQAQHDTNDGTPKPPPRIPPTIPYIGHAISNAVSFQDYTKHLARRFDRCSVLTLPMLSQKHHLIIAPSLVHQVFTSRDVTNKFSGEPFFFVLMEHVFGDAQKLFRNMDQKVLWGPVAKSVQGMMRESFLLPALAQLNQGVSSRISDLVSSDGKQQVWEQAANVRQQGSAVCASLHALLRDFVGHLAIGILLGPDFLENYPSTLPDLFALDASLSLLLSGLPRSIPALRAAAEARRRLLKALREHHVAWHRQKHGLDAGQNWSRVSQTSNVVADRIKAFALVGDFERPEDQQGILSAIGNLVVLWALNVNANQVTFWMIFHIYSNPELLAQLREELDPHVVSEHSEGRPFLKIDLPTLQKQCPLLNGAFLETMRWESAATIYRFVQEDFAMRESDEDANIFGHVVPQTYIFQKGEYICVPNGVHQSDERYFPNSKKFDARRFWVREGEARQPVDADDSRQAQTWETKEKLSQEVDYKTMHPWGGGSTVCKGKKFAEGEVLTFVAAIVCWWDIEAVDNHGQTVPWKHPGHKAGTGAVVPKKDIRAKIRQRATTHPPSSTSSTSLAPA